MTELLLDRVRWSLEAGVARIALAHPQSGNALSLPMARALLAAVQRLEAACHQGTVRAALLFAQGEHFCVGGDLQEFAQVADRQRHVGEVADTMHAAIRLLTELPVPVISLVHSTAAGGGIGLALAADIVLLAREAKLRLAYTAAGLSPDCGATWVLPQRIGLARALDLALSNRLVNGAEIEHWGLVSRVLPAADLQETAKRLLSTLSEGATEAFAETKRLMRSVQEQGLASQMNAEAASIARLVASPNGREGLEAFFAKRKPVFQ